ncbi:hypothetical protein BO70DRAFT_328527 [Aspergillus heteromorphus CBS 117.55]|uniref:Xylanolytic transcriptional activator regulatory domain-containing protein n=1 Tax=Aspergillus heteromorphus CBS 117.55 TaxID=1448321 RepID=A0A317WWB9_9EURO|nr:uncharacterized protein BO70DRAFT_328527 [Aspergillus heteromorphus CBS 117.55]PWY90686.1 hypothetical protein BO70DRAFT_328527 [Aspergillus heteromorphus CBS 117.55]
MSSPEARKRAADPNRSMRPRASGTSCEKWYANPTTQPASPDQAQSLEPEDDDENGSGSTRTPTTHQHPSPPESVFKRAIEQSYETLDQSFLFGSRKTNVDLSALHPPQAQILKLWQVYLENVDPLLKVTHTPTLQSRIINAAFDIANIGHTLEALMFGIYCVAVLSLDEDECRGVVGSPRDELLTRFRFACQQALVNCGVFRSGERESLTALFLYLISVRPDTDPRSLSSMLCVAMRNAQRMGLHLESCNRRFPALEAELRRRLWWSLMLFDHRICEMSDHKTSLLTPTWDCLPPLNVNDLDLRPEMKSPPPPHPQPSEALFPVLRSTLADFTRHSAFHLDFTNPALKPIAKDLGPDPFTTLSAIITEKYLQHCNPENPIHSLVLQTAHGQLSKSRLLEQYSTFSSSPSSTTTNNSTNHLSSSPSSTSPTHPNPDSPITHAITQLQSDTSLMTSPLTKPFRWLTHYNFPSPAYIYLIQDLKRRPLSVHADRAWEAMDANYLARFEDMARDTPMADYLGRVVSLAWAAREGVRMKKGGM